MTKIYVVYRKRTQERLGHEYEITDIALLTTDKAKAEEMLSTLEPFTIAEIEDGQEWPLGPEW